VLVSAYTIGANAANAGALTVAQTVDAGQAAFTTAGVLAFGAVIGTLLIGKRPPVADAAA
ncbi:MAG: transporter, partial [Microbacterium sp.]|nr:transporter [Microbacterium sp.]